MKHSETRKEINFVIPRDQTAGFKPFFEAFDTKLDEFKLKSYGVSMATLEEVFLKPFSKPLCLKCATAVPHYDLKTIWTIRFWHTLEPFKCLFEVVPIGKGKHLGHVCVVRRLHEDLIEGLFQVLSILVRKGLVAKR